MATEAGCGIIDLTVTCHRELVAEPLTFPQPVNLWGPWHAKLKPAGESFLYIPPGMVPPYPAHVQ